MKYFLSAAIVVGSLLSMGHSVEAQDGPVAPYAKQAMNDVGALLDKAAKEGFGMEAGTSTMFGGWLPRGKKQGNEPWVTMLTVTNLDPAKQYRVVAGGDNDTIDLDIRILGPDGKEIVSDTSTARHAEVSFKVPQKQNCVIQLRLYDSKDNCVCLGAILRK